MTQELIEKCRLTDGEIYKAQYGYGDDKHFPLNVSDEAYAPFRLVIKAQLAKAIPPIRKQERDRISSVCFKIEGERGIQLPVELWQALKATHTSKEKEVL